ncbi:MAG: response regulator [Oligoflexus sp.]
MLVEGKAQVEIANDGAEAIEKALYSKFDLILMEIQMPILDGYGTTRELRRRGFGKPTVALTAHALLEERQRSIEIGCNGHFGA